jgi:hypothetical protein
MTSLENLARLKNLALAEDAKNLGGYNQAQYDAWSAYDAALAADVADYAERKSVQKNLARLPSRLRFTNAGIAKALQTLSNLQDYSNAFNPAAVHAFLDTNPTYYHGLASALQFARLAVQSLEAEVAKRDALALAHHEKTQGI